MEKIKKYTFGVSLILLILFIVLLQYLSFENIQNLKDINKNSIAYLQQSNLLTEIKSNMANADDLNTKIIYENKNELITNYTSKILTAKKNIVVLQQNNSINNNNTDIHQLQNLVEEYSTKHSQIINLINANKQNEAFQKINITEDIILLNQIEDLCDLLIKNYSNQGLEITEIRKAKINYLNYLSWGLTVLLILFASARTFSVIEQNKKDFQLFQKLKKTEIELNKSMQIKDQFMANMSHEIRTPINVIMGYTNRLNKTSLEDNQKQYTNAILNSSNNLLHIVNDILDFSKIEAGMMRFENVVFSLPFLLQSVFEMFEIKCQEKKINLKLECSSNLPNFIVGDSNKITQILINLLGNAIKFTHTGEIKLVANSTYIDDEKCKINISVIDSGIGIAENKIYKIFDRFEQAENDTTYLYGGTGLGLSIARQITEALNGTITVLSKPNMGSTFTISIPFQISDKNAILKPNNLGIENINFANNTILIVEDNPLNTELLEMLLSDLKIQYKTAVNGVEAIKLLENNNFQLILMDIQMPSMNGYQATEYIRKTLKIDTPIIALTAHALAGEKEKCIALGMNDYVTKPIDEANLIPLLKNYLSFSIESPTLVSKNETSTNSLIDLTYLKNILKNNEQKINTILQNYVHEVPKHLQHLKLAIKNSVFEDIHFYSHRMISSISIIGLSNKIVDNLHHIENLSSQKKELEIIEKKITTIYPIILESIEEVNKLIKK